MAGVYMDSIGGQGTPATVPTSASCETLHSSRQDPCFPPSPGFLQPPAHGVQQRTDTRQMHAEWLEEPCLGLFCLLRFYMRFCLSKESCGSSVRAPAGNTRHIHTGIIRREFNKGTAYKGVGRA